jgi:hypothetical protein
MLFLDDMNDLPLSLQPKLLDVLQRKVVRGIGCNTEGRVNVRVIAAANEPLAQAVEQKRFRGDLYYRLNVVRLRASGAAGTQRGTCGSGAGFRRTAQEYLFADYVAGRIRTGSARNVFRRKCWITWSSTRNTPAPKRIERG